MADEDTGYGNKSESDSIGNQRIRVARADQLAAASQREELERYKSLGAPSLRRVPQEVLFVIVQCSAGIL